MATASDKPSQVGIQIRAFAFFTLLALAVTWPLILHLDDRVPGWGVADNYEYLWKMWWFKHSIIDLGQNPLFAPDIFYPSGFSLAHAELTPLHTVIGLPLTWLWGEITTYNLFAILSFILTGWATFLLVQRWTENAWAGMLAGVLYVLNPYHTVRYGGILPLMAIEGIPVFFLGLEGWIDTRRYRWLAVAIFGFLLAAWASIYYAFGLLILGPIYVLARLGPLRPLLRDRSAWTAMGLLGLGLLVVLVPLTLPYIQLGQELELQIPLEDTDFWSASPTDYLLPAGLHPLWGEWVRDRLLSVSEDYPQIALEFVLGVGFIAMLFAFYGWRKSRGRVRRAILWLLVVAFVLSLGPRLHFGRHPVVVPAPDSVVTLFHSVMDTLSGWLPTDETYAPLAADGLTIPLPALFLRWLLPPLEGMRAWNRFAAFTSLGVAMLAGLGYAAWIADEIKPALRRSARLNREQLAGVVVLALAIFELWPQPIPLQAVGPRPVDEWLAEQPGQFSIMELPLTSALSAPQMLYTRYHGKRITFAYGTYFPYWYRSQFPELQECPEPACLDLLQSWDVRFILLNMEDTPAGPMLKPRLDEALALLRVDQIGDIVVYQLLR